MPVPCEKDNNNLQSLSATTRHAHQSKMLSTETFSQHFVRRIQFAWVFVTECGP